MTFLEAAIEVLRREGKPLPIRQLAELAVKHNLLSVVGRDPEATMQARLAEVLDKGPTHGELLRVRDLYGLRAYPPRPYPPPREGGPAEDVVEEGGEEDEEVVGAEPGTAPAAGAAAGRGRRRRRRGRGGDRPAAPELAGEPASAERAAEPSRAADEPALPPLEAEDEGGEEEDAEFDVEGDNASSAPLMVATAGDEELTRSGEEREVRSEIMGGRRDRDDRGRRRRGERPRGHGRDKKDEGRPSPQAAAPAPSAAPPPTASSAATPVMAPISGEKRALAHDLVELLRANDSRPQHVRALAQEVERRKILDGRPQPEIVREVRMALHGESTSRAGKGLRPRVRPLGGGNYAVVDCKLDDELVAAERALEAALDRQMAATATALRRKLQRLSPFSFEQLGRSVAEALGVERPSLVRRGEGVAYFGGERTLGALRVRTLVAVRTGEAELGRRAVGELRAGLDARGFDEGLLIGLGRLSAEGREELRAGRAVTVYDGDSLPPLLVERRLGVRVSHAPVPYLDLEFFSEINET